MTNVEKTPNNVKRGLQPRRLLQTVLFFLVVGVLGDIAVEILLPKSGSPYQAIVNDLTSFHYWLRKLIFSVCAGVLYEVLLWRWKR